MIQEIETLSVVICAYTENRWNELLESVQSVRQQTQAPEEIIVVIDYNSALFQRAKTALSDDIIVIENHEEKGLSGARNSGAAIAHGSVVAFIDDDACAQPDWIEQLMACYTHQHIVGVGGKIEPRWPDLPPFWFPEEFYWVVGCTYRGMPTKKKAVRNIIGANMSVRRRVLREVGGFRSSFGCNYNDSDTRRNGPRWLEHHAGDEETEFCIRVSQSKPESQWIYAPLAVVKHCVSLQRTRWSYFLWRCYDEGLGKAALVTFHGSQTGLSSERAYTLQTLPLGILRYLLAALLHHKVTGLTRIGAIVMGLTATLLGYLLAIITRPFTANKQAFSVRSLQSAPVEQIAEALANLPVRIMEIEIGEPLPHISSFDDASSQQYRMAHCLVRLHSYPLGKIEFSLDEQGISAEVCAKNIWQALHTQITTHLQQDGLPLITQLDVMGISSTVTPHCIEERERFFANAPFVSIVVCTHDRPERMPTCLQSLLSLHYPHFEVVVVDNAPSTNATADFIQQYYSDIPQVHYVREDRAGLSRARNRGIIAAKGIIIAFTDDDVIVDPYWLIELVRAFSVTEDVTCVSGLILPYELETSAQLWFEEFGGFSKGFAQRIFVWQRGRSETPLHPYTAGRFGTGASMAFTSTFLYSIGGFDPAIGVSTPAQNGDDLAIFFQVLASKHKIVYQPSALLYHIHRRDYPGLQKQIYTYGAGLTAYLMKSMLDHPHLLLNLLVKLPYGVYFTLSSRSSKNRKKSAHYPLALTLSELKGMLYGPLGYLRSRQAIGKGARGLGLAAMTTSRYSLEKEI